MHSLIIPKRVLDGIDWTACPMQFPGFLKGERLGLSWDVLIPTYGTVHFIGL